MDIREKVRKLPQSPGVYIMKSKRGRILYVGKAISLKRRVASYFRGSLPDVKTNILVEKISDIDFIPCDTEAQALILEASLIKEKKPKYNIALRDDKSYPYIVITNETFPRIFPSRSKKKDNLLLFGPYPNVKLVKEALQLVRRIFPYRSCSRFPKIPCLYYHLDLCPAPCAGKISANDYKDTITNLYKILSGNKKSLIKRLEKRMFEASRNKQFEKAASLRNKIVAVRSLYSGKSNVGEIVSLRDILKLDSLPLVIEAIDISDISGTSAAGSVVVFKDGVPDKNNYRRFHIKGSYRDDYRMLGEIVKRRYSRLKEGKYRLPGLVIVDGGRGHANIAFKTLREMHLDIPTVGIAKRNEELWFAGAKKPLVISKDNPALQLIQRIRDEAHRFAHKYHTLLRKKKILNK